MLQVYKTKEYLLVNPSNAQLNPICHLLALLGTHHILHVSRIRVNPLNTKLNPICHLLVLLGAHHILHVSRIRVNIFYAFLMAHAFLMPWPLSLLDQVPRRHFEKGRDGIGIVGCYCKYGKYAVADGRQGVLLHVGDLLEICRRVAI